MVALAARISSELRLAAACCRWPASPDRDRLVRASADGVDWQRFGRVIARHRVEGLVAPALLQANVALPPQLAGALQAESVAIAQRNLAHAAESARLARRFEAESIPFLFVKGSTLDQLAYGQLGLKRGRDIDLAIAPGRLADACAALEADGYQRIVPGPEIGREAFPAWVEHCKETAWRHRGRDLLVELHNGLVDNPHLLRGVTVGSPSQAVRIGPGLTLPTLQDPELYAYLCVHGATHAWSRLKWLADLAAFLSRFSAPEIEALHRAAAARGAGRASAQALLLAAELLGLVLPAELGRELRRDLRVRLLAAAAVRVLNDERELDETVLGTLPIHLSHFLLAEGSRAMLAEGARKLRSPHDRAAIALPRPLHFLYAVLAVPSWLWRRLRGPAPL